MCWIKSNDQKRAHCSSKEIGEKLTISHSFGKKNTTKANQINRVIIEASPGQGYKQFSRFLQCVAEWEELSPISNAKQNHWDNQSTWLLQVPTQITPQRCSLILIKGLVYRVPQTILRHLRPDRSLSTKENIHKRRHRTPKERQQIKPGIFLEYLILLH